MRRIGSCSFLTLQSFVGQQSLNLALDLGFAELRHYRVALTQRLYRMVPIGRKFLAINTLSRTITTGSRGWSPHPTILDEGYSDCLTALGARIRVRRKECGLSYTNLLRQYGYGSAQWGKYELGGCLSLPSLVKLALISKTTPSALLDGTPLPELD